MTNAAQRVLDEILIEGPPRVIAEFEAILGDPVAAALWRHVLHRHLSDQCTSPAELGDWVKRLFAQRIREIARNKP